MKRSYLALGALIVVLFVVMYLALWKANRASDVRVVAMPSGVIDMATTSSSELAIAASTTTSGAYLEKEEDFSRNPLIYFSNRWRLGVRLPDGATTTHRWRLGDIDQVERTVFAVEVVRSAQPVMPECRVRLWLREGPMNGAYGDQDVNKGLIYTVTGNEQAHVMADSLDLCGTVIEHEIGDEIKATHLTIMTGTDVSASCHDYRLDWKTTTGKNVVIDSVVGTIFGGKQVVSEGGCMPYSLTAMAIPKSENFLISQWLLGFPEGGLGDDPVAIVQKSSGRLVLSNAALGKLSYKTRSPDSRYLFGVDMSIRMPVEAAVQTQAIVIYDLVTGKMIPLRTGEIPSGRWVGAPFSDQDPATTPPVVQWTGPRSLEVMTINPVLSSIEAQKRSVLLVPISF
ncbi:hypothetical protein KBD34_01170 [Patescibacteria group bacterium]|nr:hypothetical protein [Patescibacteria group bacterium]